MALQVSQRCKVTFEKGATIPTRHYLLVGPDNSRFDEVWSKVLAEYRKVDFHEGRDLASLYWIDSETDEVLLDSQEAYDSAVSYLVPDHGGISFLKLFARSKPTGPEGSHRQKSRPVTASISSTCPSAAITIAVSTSAQVETKESTRPSRGLQRPYYGGIPAGVQEALMLEPSFDTASKIKTTNGAGKAKPKPKPLQFLCKKCKELFTTRRLLKAHLVSHTNEMRRTRREQKKQLQAQTPQASASLRSDSSVYDFTAPGEDAHTVSAVQKTEMTNGEAHEKEEDAEKTRNLNGGGEQSDQLKCPKCDKEFDSIRKLRGHQTVHSPANPKKRRLLHNMLTQKQVAGHLRGSRREGNFESSPIRDDSPGLDGLIAQVDKSRGVAAAAGATNGTVIRSVKSEEKSANLLDQGIEVGRGYLKATLPEGNSMIMVQGLGESGLFPCWKCDRVFAHVRQLRGHQAAHTAATRSLKRQKRKREGDEGALSAPNNASGTGLAKGTTLPVKKRRRNFKNARKIAAVSSELAVDATIVEEIKTTVKQQSVEGSPLRDVTAVESTPTAVGQVLLNCTKCDRVFLTKKQLQGHQAFHSEKGKFTCESCHHGFRTREVLVDHQNSCAGLTSASPRKFSCVPACGRLFEAKRMLAQHGVSCGFVNIESSRSEDHTPADDYIHIDGHDRATSVEISEKAVSPVAFAVADSSATVEEEPHHHHNQLVAQLLPQTPLRHTGQRERPSQISAQTNVIVKRKQEDCNTSPEMPRFLV
ncbi:hypothetical protein BV898_05274 [Hypsibius exemplaris]|uniref:C2H2-type domain-containing protein n=1 Tax=Hypsibius exemplaris TaxID=2072580 RepID=A0A1W0WZP9_HYPEX|nr:hypothetical protein BV898_05274 [Hypsibius exemplaris]